MIFPVLLHSGSGETEGHDEKNDSSHFQPQLVGGAAERSQSRANPAHDRVERAAASGLLPGDARHHAQLLQGRNFAHALDFNSLRRYNDATPGNVRQKPANRSAAECIQLM